MLEYLSSSQDFLCIRLSTDFAIAAGLFDSTFTSARTWIWSTSIDSLPSLREAVVSVSRPAQAISSSPSSFTSAGAGIGPRAPPLQHRVNKLHVLIVEHLASVSLLYSPPRSRCSKGFFSQNYRRKRPPVTILGVPFEPELNFKMQIIGIICKNFFRPYL